MAWCEKDHNRLKIINQKTMKNIFLIILMLIPSMVFSQNKCKVTYISNEGFLIELDDKKVLIDALFDKIDGEWCDSPSDSIVQLMKRSEPPFDKVDIIAISHKHVDHFNENIVIDHMLSNPKAIVICPDQVGELLSKNSKYGKINDRIISITPKSLTDTNIVISNTPIRVIRLEHSHYEMKDTVSGTMINKHQNIENLGYLFNINGIKLFHCGDTNPLNEVEYSAFSLHDEEIDIAFIERLFFGVYQEKGMEMINKFINPDYMILMHITPTNKRFFIDYFKQEKNIKIFENKMESIIININD